MLITPLSPVRSFAAKRLLKALSDAPGVGGPQWLEAITKIQEERTALNEAGGKPNPGQEAVRFAENINYLLAEDRFDETAGLPADAIARRCDWVVELLAKLVGDDPGLGVAIGHARDLKTITAAGGPFSRVQINRILDSVIDVGAPDPLTRAEAAPWSSVVHPGQITATRDTVIWWDFKGGDSSNATYWSKGEATSLLKSGIILDPSSARRARESWAWSGASRYAKRRLLLCRPGNDKGEAAAPHPYWDEIRANLVKPGAPEADLETAEREITITCAELVKDGVWHLLDRSVKWRVSTVIEPAKPQAVYDIAPGLDHHPDHLNYSKMRAAIACPFQWVARNTVLTARHWDVAPATNQMIGNLCHKIVEELYGGDTPAPAINDVETLAKDRFEALTPVMAAPLLMPENALERRAFRQGVGQAIHRFAVALDQYGLTVHKTEEEVTRDYTGVPFKGRIDLILCDKSNRTYVMDLKWTDRLNSFETEIEDGSLQLATYAWLLAGDNLSGVDGAYFMLAQGRVLSGANTFGSDAVPNASSLAEGWRKGIATWEDTLSEVVNGKVRISGLADLEQSAVDDYSKLKTVWEDNRSAANEASRLFISPFCRNCDYSVLCGRALWEQ